MRVPSLAADTALCIDSVCGARFAPRRDAVRDGAATDMASLRTDPSLTSPAEGVSPPLASLWMAGEGAAAARGRARADTPGDEVGAVCLGLSAPLAFEVTLEGACCSPPCGVESSSSLARSPRTAFSVFAIPLPAPSSTRSSRSPPAAIALLVSDVSALHMAAAHKSPRRRSDCWHLECAHCSPATSTDSRMQIYVVYQIIDSQHRSVRHGGTNPSS